MSKTEEATPKRLRKAQAEGDSPLSTFASQGVAFACAVAVAPAATLALVTRSTADLRAAVAHAGDLAPRVTFDPAFVAEAVLGLAAPVLAAAALSAAIASFVQTGGAISTKKLAPNLSKLDPIAGLSQLFSAQRVVALVRAALFAGVVAWIAYAVLRSDLGALARTSGRLGPAMTIGSMLALDVAKRTAAVGLFLAAIDIVIVRRSWRKRLRMSKEEVKREHRESEGDPQLKAARDRAHHEMLASATIANVKNASVVVVNPTHIACALRYEGTESGGEDEAPVLVAAGHGDLARRIVEAAHHYGVPVLRDVPLARALVELEIGAEIPEALYEAVAEILREAWDGERRA